MKRFLITLLVESATVAAFWYLCKTDVIPDWGAFVGIIVIVMTFPTALLAGIRDFMENEFPSWKEEAEEAKKKLTQNKK